MTQKDTNQTRTVCSREGDLVGQEVPEDELKSRDGSHADPILKMLKPALRHRNVQIGYRTPSPSPILSQPRDRPDLWAMGERPRPSTSC